MAEDRRQGRFRMEGQRVVFVLWSLSRTGAERQAFLLARHLKQVEAADVLLVSLDGTGGIETLARAAGLRIAFFPLTHRSGKRLRQIWDLLRFARFLRRERPDVVLSYCMFPNVLSALTWRMGGARLCIWGQRDEGRERLERWVEWLAVRSVSCFVSNSQHATRFLIDTLGRDSADVHVIPNGVEAPPQGQSPDKWRRALHVPARAFVAGMMATLHRFKDHATLVSAWRLVVDALDRDGVEAHLILAGQKAGTYPTLVAQVDALGLNQRVHFVGEVDDVGGLLRSLDLFVFSSYNEGVPNAVLEAMACGLPVVGTDYAGIREAVGDQLHRNLAAKRDPYDLAARILGVIRDPDWRAQCGAIGQARVAEHFALETMCERATRLLLEQTGRTAAASIG